MNIEQHSMIKQSGDWNNETPQTETASQENGFNFPDEKENPR